MSFTDAWMVKKSACTHDDVHPMVNARNVTCINHRQRLLSNPFEWILVVSNV